MSFPFFFDGTSNIVIGGSMGIGTTVGRRPLDVIGETYTTSAFISSNLGIGTTITLTKLEVHSTDGVLLPRGGTGQRPVPNLRGYIRYNTDTDQFEGYGAANNWGSLGGVKSTDQTTYISAELTAGANDSNLRFYNGDNLSMIVTPLGSVGIGTSQPLYKLDVLGSVNATNYFGNASGLSNITSQLMWITGGGLRVANQKLVVDGDLFVGGNIYGACNTSVFTGGSTLPSIISPNVVTSSNIVDGSITFAKLDASAYNFQWMAVTGGGLRTSQKVVVDGDLIVGGNIYNASNVDLNSLYPGGAILGCNIGVGVINTSNLVDRSVTIPKIDFTSNLPVYFGGNVGIGTTLSAATGLAVNGSASIGTYANSAAPANSLIVSGNVGIGTTVTANKFAVNGSASIGTYANTAAPANSLIVSGNVGIGTTNPADLLALGPNGAAFPAPSGAAPLYACRAWVNFDGTTAGTNPAPMTIRGSGNVSSVTRNGTGDYTVTFTTSMPDGNYAISISTIYLSYTNIYSAATNTVSSVRIIIHNSAGTVTNRDVVCVSIIR